MAEVKNAFIKSKMNKDLDARLIPQGEYRDAINVQVSKSEGDDVGALENVLGNYSIADFATDSGISDIDCIGYFVDQTNKIVYLFFTNYTDPYVGNSQAFSAAASNFIYSYNISDSSINKLVEGSFLNFSTNRPIMGVNLLEDFLFFTDNRNQPRKINVKFALEQGASYYTTEDQISVAKYYPYESILLIKDSTISPGNKETSMYDASNNLLPDGTTNNPYYDANFAGDSAYLEDKFVRFSYRFKFIDGEYSLIAPFTQPCFIPKQDGYFLDGDEKQTFASTVVEFMENKVNKIALQIPLPVAANSLESSFHISEIDIIYKESDGLALQVVETIPVSEITGSGLIFEYIYNSTKPYKTLPSEEITRVFDKVPVKALGQEVISNRIVYGNFQNKHTSPSFLKYQVAASEKYAINSAQAFPASSRVEYPNHSLKQNRNYQVGVVLSDRYGRQSTTILSNDTSDADGDFKADTVYLPYRSLNDSISFAGDSLKVLFNEVITSNKNENTFTPGLYNNNFSSGKVNILGVSAVGNNYQNDTYSTTNVSGSGSGLTVAITQTGGFITSATVVTPGNDYKIGDVVNVVASGGQTGTQGTLTITDIITPYNPLGWYSYKIVVKQIEQEYYNVYTAGAMKGLPYNYDDPATNPVVTIEKNTSFITLINDNINKVPRDLSEVGPQDKTFRSSVKLFGRVENITNEFSNIGNAQFIPGRKSFTTNAIEDLYDLFDVLQFQSGNQVVPITDPTNAFHPFYKSDSNPFIAEFITSNNPNLQFGIENDYDNVASEWIDIENLAVLETAPTVSRLNIYYETSTAGLVSELNTAIGEDAGGAYGTLNFIYSHSEANEPETVIVNEFSFTDILDVVITPDSLPTINSVIDNSGSEIDRSSEFTLVQGATSNTYDLKTAAGEYFYYGSNGATLESYTFTFSVTVSGTTTQVQTVGALSNVNPSIDNSNASTIQKEQGDLFILPNITGKNGSNDSNPNSNIYIQGLTFSIASSTGAGTYSVVNNNEVRNSDTAASGSGSFTLRVTDAGGATEEKTFNVNFGPPPVPQDFNVLASLQDGDGYAVWFTNNTTNLEANTNGYLNFYLVGFDAPTSTNSTNTENVCSDGTPAATFVNVTKSSGLTQGTFYAIIGVGNSFIPNENFEFVYNRYSIQYRATSSDNWVSAVDINNKSVSGSNFGGSWTFSNTKDGFDEVGQPTTGLQSQTQSTAGITLGLGALVWAFNQVGEYRIIIGNVSSSYGFFQTGPNCTLPEQNLHASASLSINDFYNPPNLGVNPDGDGIYEYRITNNTTCSNNFNATGTPYYSDIPFAKYITQLYTDTALTTEASITAGTYRFRRMASRGSSGTYNPENTVNGAYTATFTSTGLRTGDVSPCLY